MIQSYKLKFMNPNPSSSFGGFKETNINQFLKFRPKSLLLIKKNTPRKRMDLSMI